jgi:hypothetical protein
MNMHIVMAVLSLALLIWAGPASAQARITASVSIHKTLPPLSRQEVRKILHDASHAPRKGNGQACVVPFKLKGNIGRFGSAVASDPNDPTPAIIANEKQKDAVHMVDSQKHARFHIKIVEAINFCIPPGAPGASFNGCAFHAQHRSIIVVHPAKHGVANFPDHVLWAHEYGHLTGLSHRTMAAPQALMTGCSVTPTSVQVTNKECRCLRLGPRGCGFPTPRPCIP